MLTKPTGVSSNVFRLFNHMYVGGKKMKKPLFSPSLVRNIHNLSEEKIIFRPSNLQIGREMENRSLSDFTYFLYDHSFFFFANSFSSCKLHLHNPTSNNPFSLHRSIVRIHYYEPRAKQNPRVLLPCLLDQHSIERRMFPWEKVDAKNSCLLICMGKRDKDSFAASRILGNFLLSVLFFA